MNTKQIVEVASRERRRLGLTQAEVGKAIGVTTQTISNIEQGKHLPRVDRLIAYLEAVGLALKLEGCDD